jgi:large conductance mechanosensitive channel
MWSDFKSFLLKTNALALAIGVIIGGALGTVVTSLVNDIIMPPIGQLLGKVDFSNLKVVLQKATDPADPTTEVAIRWGAFLNAVVAFVIIAFVVWRISKMFIREEATPTPPEQKTCPYCRQFNAIDATKCMYCASVI